MDAKTTSTTTALVNLAIESAIEHVGLVAFERRERQAQGMTADECDAWSDCVADTDPGMGLWQTYQSEGHPTEAWGEFCSAYRSAVRLSAGMAGVPLR